MFTAAAVAEEVPNATLLASDAVVVAPKASAPVAVALALKPYAAAFAFYTSLDYTIDVCLSFGHTACTINVQTGGIQYGYCSRRYHPHPQTAPLRSSKLRGAAGGHGFQDPLHGLWPRGHAAPGKDREEHQKGHQTGPGIARRHSTFRNCFVRRTA